MHVWNKICKQILPKIGLADGETEAYFSKKPKHFWPKYFTCTTFPEFQFVFASKSNTCTCLESNFASKSGTLTCRKKSEVVHILEIILCTVM